MSDGMKAFILMYIVADVWMDVLFIHNFHVEMGIRLDSSQLDVWQSVD